MDEYLVVIFDEDRGVMINNASGSWTTNQVLQLQAGTYVVTLVPPPNFTPKEITVVLTNTTVLDPREIRFKRVPA